MNNPHRVQVSLAKVSGICSRQGEVSLVNSTVKLNSHVQKNNMKLLFLSTTKFSSNWTKAKFIENAKKNI